MEQLESIYFAFFWDGPGIRYSTSPGFGGRGPGGSFPTYEELMMQADWDGDDSRLPGHGRRVPHR